MGKRSSIGNKSGFGWNRAVVIIGISDRLTDDKGEEITISEFIEETQLGIIGLSEEKMGIKGDCQ